MKKFNTKEMTCFFVVYQNLLTIPRSLIMYDGSQLYEHQNHLTSRYTFFDYYNHYYTNTFIDKETTPHLIITACGSFPHLDSVRYTQDIVENLNNVGLNIYIYETIFLDTGKNKRKSLNAPKTDINNLDLIEEYNNIKHSLVGFESTSNNLENMYCFEFEKIQEFIERNNLTNVTIYTGDYNLSKYFSNLYPRLTFKTQDICLVSFFKESISQFTSYEYITDQTPANENSIEYKFWCGTRRSEGYRHLVVAYLLERSSLCSYQFKVEDSPFRIFDIDKNRTTPLWGELQNYLWFDLSLWEEKYPDIYKKILEGNEIIKLSPSQSIDRNIEDSVSPEWYPVPIEYYKKCFCAVVTEARYALPTGNLSEKTLNAIKCFRPFILVASPYTLEYLKHYGVKTFSQFWDESYDREENHEQRLIKIFEVIDYIDSFTVDELKTLYSKMTPILEHNYQIIKNIAKVRYYE